VNVLSLVIKDIAYPSDVNVSGEEPSEINTASHGITLREISLNNGFLESAPKLTQMFSNIAVKANPAERKNTPTLPLEDPLPESIMTMSRSGART
jgi:hypothetical protein